MTRFAVNIGLRRFLALLLAPAFLALMFDAAVAHFAGKEPESPAQAAPILAGIFCTALTLIAGSAKLSPRGMGAMTATAGGVAILVGLVGTVLHMRMLVLDLADEAVTFDSIVGALGVAPPMLAPAGFVGVGAAVIALGSRRFRLEFAQPGDADDARPSAQPPMPASERAA